MSIFGSLLQLQIIPIKKWGFFLGFHIEQNINIYKIEMQQIDGIHLLYSSIIYEII